MSLRYVNGTNREIRVKDRFGMNTILTPSKSERPAGYFDVYLVWEMTEETYRATLRDFQYRYAAAGSITRQMLSSLHNGVDNVRHNGTIRSYEVQVEFRIEDLKDAGGTVYIEELDIVICLGSYDKKDLEHPFSPLNRVKKGLASEIPSLGEQTFVMSVRAIDNGLLNNRRARYMLLGDQVFYIPVEQDASMPNGIHVTSRLDAETQNLTGPGRQVITRHLSFEEADVAYNMFDTIEQARRGVNATESRKEELLRRQYEQKISDLEKSGERSEREHQFWREKAEFERAHAREKEERQQRRAREEEVKENTKTFSEWMRFVTTIVTATAAFVTTMFKMKPV